jgi:hypothetical protein
MLNFTYPSIIIFSIFSAIILIILRQSVNSYQNKKDFSLKPNCLLTRYPILFITHASSISPFSPPEAKYIFYLKEHGYEIIELKLPRISKKLRTAYLDHFFKNKELKKKYHLFISNHLSELTPWIENNYLQHIESVQNTGAFIASSKSDKNSLLHKGLLLSHVQDLAEKEWA